MSTDWESAGFPSAIQEGYGYSVAAGLRRTPIQTRVPRQKRDFDQRPRSFGVRYIIEAERLYELEAWIDANGFAWHTQPLVTADSGGVGATAHRVRFTGELSVSLPDAAWAEVAATIEQEAADEPCALADTVDDYLVCLGAGCTVSSGIEWDAIAAVWDLEPYAEISGGAAAAGSGTVTPA